MSRGQLLRKVISVVIIFQIAFGTAIAKTSQGQSFQAKSVSPEELKTNYWKMRFAQLELENPLWQDFEKQLQQSDLSNDIAANDPLVDQDPYFLRSQSWAPAQKTNSSFVDDVLNGYYFSKDKDGVTIRIPGVQKNLRLNVPMTPVQVTEDYVILTANTDSTLFEDKLTNDDGENKGEGFFFISISELMQSAQNETPAAIYFFPLPGNGWKGSLDSYDMKELNTVVLENSDGEALPIDMTDVASLMKYEQVVRMLATVDTMNSGNVMDPKTFVYPDAGTTAGFGIMGLDRKTTLVENAQKILNQVGGLILPQAKAFDVQFDPKTLAQIVYYGKLIAVLIGGAIVLKYTLMKKKLNQIHKMEKKTREAAGQKDPGAVKQWFQDVFSVFAHLTTSMQQIGTVTLGIAIELLVDKTLPEYAAGEHKMMRKILSKSVLWSRKSSSQIAVNWKTFFLGTVILGETIDTPFVVFQDLWFFPHFAQAIAPYMPEYFKNRLNDIFVANFEASKKTLIPGIIRNGAGWMMSGSSSYAMDSRSNMLPRVQKEVDDYLARMNLDPHNPKNQGMRENLVNTKMNNIMRQRGLPGQESFMFDVNSIFKNVTSGMGYQSDKTIANPGSFTLEKRPALTKNAIRKALRLANERYQANPIADNLSVVDILKKVLKDMNLLDLDLIKNPIEKLQRMRSIRKTLTLLSYEGDLTYIVTDWAREFSPDAANGAGILFRKALFSYLSSEGEALIELPKSTVEKYGQQAVDMVRIEIQNENPEVTVDQWIEKRPLEYEIMIDSKIRELEAPEKHEEKILAYEKNMKPDDWMAKRQKARAEALTAEALSLEPNASKDRWKQVYSQTMARVLGLYITSDTSQSLLAEAHAMAEEQTQQQMKTTVGLSEYMKKLSEYQRLKFESDIYSVNFLTAYRDLTTQKDDPNKKIWTAHMLSPDQPGKFQRVRQTNMVRKSIFLTRFFRWADSWFEDEEFQPGLKSWTKRNIPLGNDMVTAWTSFYRGFLTNVTLRYAVLVSVFHVSWSWSTYTWFYLLSPWFIGVPSNWINRFFRQQGMKAMDTVRSKAFYGLLYSPATMWATIPFMLWYGDFGKLVNGELIPFAQSVSNAIPGSLEWTAAVVAGVGLSPQVREWVRQKVRTLRSDKVEISTVKGESFSGAFCVHLFEQ